MLQGENENNQSMYGDKGIGGDRRVRTNIRIREMDERIEQTFYVPAQIRRAYGFEPDFTGEGRTVAVVEAFGNQNIEYDLAVFCSRFNLPKADLKVVYPQGPTSIDGGWALETSLDVQWIHALAPRAKILLVAAKSNLYDDIFPAVDYAANHGAQIVSMSWGGYEYQGETAYDKYFQHENVVFVASSGDVGSQAVYPSTSQFVLSVGGTRLELDQKGNRIGEETAWEDSGGGPSAYIPMPFWQTIFGLGGIGNNHRCTPDVSFDADPNTGVAIYSSIPYNGRIGWFIVGGTSFGAPAWSALIACAEQGRRPFTNISELLYKAAGTTGYSEPQHNFYDITQGSSGYYRATQGYDLVTGLGTPVANRLVRILHSLRG